VSLAGPHKSHASFRRASPSTDAHSSVNPGIFLDKAKIALLELCGVVQVVALAFQQIRDQFWSLFSKFF